MTMNWTRTGPQEPDTAGRITRAARDYRATDGTIVYEASRSGGRWVLHRDGVVIPVRHRSLAKAQAFAEGDLRALKNAAAVDAAFIAAGGEA